MSPVLPRRHRPLHRKGYLGSALAPLDLPYQAQAVQVACGQSVEALRGHYCSRHQLWMDRHLTRGLTQGRLLCSASVCSRPSHLWGRSQVEPQRNPLDSLRTFVPHLLPFYGNDPSEMYRNS